MQKRMQTLVRLLLPVLAINAGFPSANALDIVPAYVETLEKTLRSCVRIVSQEDRSSGVLVSPKGHILTVAHGLAADAERVEVLTAKGTRLSARVLHRDLSADVALLQLESIKTIAAGDNIPVSSFANHATADRLVDTTAFAIGYPAREPNSAGPVCRMGTVQAATPLALRTSCVLTAGDSGGPLLTPGGALLGIHQKIGLGRRSNLHLPLHKCRAVLAEVLKEEGITLAGDDSEQHDDSRLLRFVPPVVTQRLQHLTVRIIADDRDTTLSLGTRISTQLVATKLSLLTPTMRLSIRFHDGTTLTGEQVHTNRDLDLAILRVDENATVPSSDDGKKSKAGLLTVGTIAFTGGDPVLPGLVARMDHTEPSAVATLGCTLSQAGDLIKVDRINVDSAASEAGLRPNDVLATVDGKVVADLDAVASALAVLQPGDRLSLSGYRGTDTISGFGQLRHQPNALLDRAEFLDGRAGRLSLRRTDFAHVIQHDAGLEAANMGGPIVDGGGTLVGINIARRSREAVLAIPLATVLRVVESMD